MPGQDPQTRRARRPLSLPGCWRWPVFFRRVALPVVNSEAFAALMQEGGLPVADRVCCGVRVCVCRSSPRIAFLPFPSSMGLMAFFLFYPLGFSERLSPPPGFPCGANWASLAPVLRTKHCSVNPLFCLQRPPEWLSLPTHSVRGALPLERGSRSPAAPLVSRLVRV